MGWYPILKEFIFSVPLFVWSGVACFIVGGIVGRFIGKLEAMFHMKSILEKKFLKKEK